MITLDRLEQKLDDAQRGQTIMYSELVAIRTVLLEILAKLEKKGGKK